MKAHCRRDVFREVEAGAEKDDTGETPARRRPGADLARPHGYSEMVLI
jgi:hypothetical protein